MKRRQPLDGQLESVELLGEPVRRALYRHVVRQPGEVSRDDAAAAVGISRDLAAFHLEKLVGAGLLEPVYRRLTGRSGPGAGRPSKLYRRAVGEIEISIPQREYHLASQVFARALGLSSAAGAPDRRLNQAARELGLEIGRRSGQGADLLAVLEDYGYQPIGPEQGKVRLRNCPFHALAQEFRQSVCEMNLALLEGIRVGAEEHRWRAQMEPAEGWCCVVLTIASGGR